MLSKAVQLKEQEERERSESPESHQEDHPEKLKSLFESSIERSNINIKIQRKLEQSKPYLLSEEDDSAYINRIKKVLSNRSNSPQLTPLSKMLDKEAFFAEITKKTSFSQEKSSGHLSPKNKVSQAFIPRGLSSSHQTVSKLFGTKKHPKKTSLHHSKGKGLLSNKKFCDTQTDLLTHSGKLDSFLSNPKYSSSAGKVPLSLKHTDLINSQRSGGPSSPQTAYSKKYTTLIERITGKSSQREGTTTPKNQLLSHSKHQIKRKTARTLEAEYYPDTSEAIPSEPTFRGEYPFSGSNGLSTVKAPSSLNPSSLLAEEEALTVPRVVITSELTETTKKASFLKSELLSEAHREYENSDSDFYSKVAPLPVSNSDSPNICSLYHPKNRTIKSQVLCESNFLIKPVEERSESIRPFEKEPEEDRLSHSQSNKTLKRGQKIQREEEIKEKDLELTHREGHQDYRLSQEQDSVQQVQIEDENDFERDRETCRSNLNDQGPEIPTSFYEHNFSHHQSEDSESTTYYLLHTTNSSSMSVPSPAEMTPFLQVSSVLAKVIGKVRISKDVYEDIREYVDRCQSAVFNSFESFFINESAKALFSRVLKLERWAMIYLFNYTVNKQEYESRKDLKKKFLDMLITLWRVNQLCWIWLQRVSVMYRFNWQFDLNESLNNLSSKLTNMCFFKKIHQVTQTLLDEINVM